jgi:acylglycerol lipase
LIEKCFKRPEKVIEARSDPLGYKKSPRLQSAVNMMRATDQIAASMEKLRHPVLILHGAADVITCPEISKELYNRCSSSDKSLKIYPECWHNMLVGEPEETSKEIFNDIITWLKSRCDKKVAI